MEKFVKPQYKNKVCVIIPIYNEQPEKSEVYSIKRTISRLHDLKIVYMAPQNLELSVYPGYEELEVVRFENKWFESTNTYSKLLMQAEFYRCFRGYEFVLICQPDVFVIGDSLQLISFAEKEYDYWGAPWYYRARAYKKRCLWYKILWPISKPKRVYVGNGGLSLRRVSKMIEFFEEFSREVIHTDELEDYFIAYYADKSKCGLRIADVEEAALFSQETGAREKFLLTKNLPFGIHAWLKYFPEVIFEDETFK